MKKKHSKLLFFGLFLLLTMAFSAPVYAVTVKIQNPYKTEEAKIDSKKYRKVRKEYWSQAQKAVKKAGVKNGMSDKTAVKKISSWICKHTTYRLTKKRNFNTSTLFKKGYGQCCDYSDAFKSMCKVCGIPCKEYWGKAKDGGTKFFHAWNRVKVGKTWYWIDTCFMDSGFYKQYNLTKKLWKDHYNGKVVDPALS